MSQRSSRSVRRPENCLDFFRIRRFFFLLLDLGGTALGLGGGRRRLRTILGGMTSTAAEHAKVVVKAALPFRGCELSVLSELVGKGGGITGGSGRLAGLVVVALALVRIAISGSRSVRFFVGLVVGLVFGLAFLGSGLLAVSLPVTGVDGMSESLHGVESGRLALLAHNILDALRPSGIITVREGGIFPAGLDRETGEFDVILDNVLIVLHFQTVNPVLSVGGRIDGAELSAEHSDEGGPVGDPRWNLLGVKDRRLKIL